MVVSGPIGQLADVGGVIEMKRVASWPEVGTFCSAN